MYLFHSTPSSVSSSPPRTPKFIHRLRTHLLPTPVLKDFILLTSDTHGLTGIALLIASFTQSTMPAYHAVIVVNIAWMSSLSHHLAILYVFPAFSSPHPKCQRKQRTMRNIRLGVIAIYALLYISFCARTYTHLRTRWSEECFAICPECSGTRGEMAEVLSWTVAGAVIFLLAYVPFVISLVQHGREEAPPARPESGRRSVVVVVVMAAMRKLYEVVISVPTSLVGMSFWTAFSAFGTSRYRAGGGIGEEERWGFGQVLAVLGLGVVVFEGVKVFCGMYDIYIPLLLGLGCVGFFPPSG